jgi:hypothetical protein
MFYFYFSETCKKDRQRQGWKPLAAEIEGKVVEVTHYTTEKHEGVMYHPDERYLGQGRLRRWPRRLRPSSA